MARFYSTIGTTLGFMVEEKIDQIREQVNSNL